MSSLWGAVLQLGDYETCALVDFLDDVRLGGVPKNVCKVGSLTTLKMAVILILYQRGDRQRCKIVIQ